MHLFTWSTFIEHLYVPDTMQTLGVSVVPKATLRFNNSLEELSELRIAVIFIFMVQYSKRIRLKSAKENGM